MKTSGLRRFLFSRFGLVILSLALTFSLLELGFRSSAWYQGNFGRLEDLEHDDVTVPEESQPVPLGTLRRYRLSANPRIVYELKPGLQFIDTSGRTYTINDSGFRGREYPIEKATRTVRIVGLGDSYMYGNGVSDDEGFLERLSVKLDRGYANRRWEIINTAVGGYNTVMEVETLKEKGLRYDPDIVLILFVGNDLNLPNFIRRPVDFFAAESFLLKFVTRALGQAGGLVAAPRSTEGHWFEGDPRRVPIAYRGMVGLRAYREAMAELKALSTRHGFEVIVFQQGYRDYVTEVCDALGLPLVHFQPALADYMQKHGIPRFKGSVLSVSETDPHPSAESHRIFAEVAFDFLEQSGALERARLRTGPVKIRGAE